MNYTYLRQGDRLPAVGVLQKLLIRTGARLRADGIFGPRTKAAVEAFQRARGLKKDGIVGKKTWPRISANTNLQIVDCIDVFDPALLTMETRDIRSVGGNPIVIGGMSNGVEQAVNDIRAASRSVFLLRFHGHGARGVASISSGHGDLDPNLRHRSDIALANLAQIRPVISRLFSIFSAYGCVQFMHCETGGGSSGRQLLAQIARLLGVPVSAGVLTQYGGGLRTFRFEGPTHTALPGGGTLANWCRGLPNFAGFTPA